MYSGRAAAVRPLTSENWPSSVIRPMSLATAWANQSAPSGATVMPSWSPASVTSYCGLEVPSRTSRAIFESLPSGCVYQRLPSGPATMSQAASPGTSNVTTSPAGVTRPIRPPKSVTQTAPPAVARLRRLKPVTSKSEAASSFIVAGSIRARKPPCEPSQILPSGPAAIPAAGLERP